MDNAIAEWDRLRVSLREDFSVSLLTEFDGFLKSLASHGEDNRLFLLIFEMIHEHPLFLKKLGFENEMRNVLKNITNNQAKETWLSHTVLIVENLPKSLPIWPRLETGFGQTFTTVLEILGSIKMLPPNHSKTEEILDDFSTLIPWFPASGIGIDMVDEIVVKLKKLPVKFLESLFQAPSFIYQQLSTKARSSLCCRYEDVFNHECLKLILALNEGQDKEMVFICRLMHEFPYLEQSFMTNHYDLMNETEQFKFNSIRKLLN